MRLIDADKFEERVLIAGGFVEEELTDDFKDGILCVLNMMKTEPTVEAVPMSVIEDIKAEIQKELKLAEKVENLGRSYAFENTLKIIDKHISGKENK